MSEVKPTIEAIYYKSPNGAKENLVVTNIYPDDAKYINDNKIKVSMEELPNGVIAVYFDDGKKTPDGEPDEITMLDIGRTCEETIADGVRYVKARKPADTKPETDHIPDHAD